MRIVKMKGGLGNQMFQYAFAKYLEAETDEKVKLDFHQYRYNTDDAIRKPRIMKFQLSLDSASVDECNFLFPHKSKSTSLLYKAGIFAEKSLNKKYCFQKGLVFDSSITEPCHYYYDGYWQSVRYIEAVKDVIRKEFVPNYHLHNSTLQMIETVSSQNSVFIGVRKGDYSKNAAMRKSWGSFDSTYYQSCMNYIEARIDDPVFYVFSNDIDWCKKNLDFAGHNYQYRENSSVIDDFEELQIMASCKHAIIVNSTFNWWGAWLNDNEDKIVCCPANWYFNGQKTEILPREWIKFK